MNPIPLDCRADCVSSFAFWLRSSVVSVLFSLISEIHLTDETLIILIFVLRELTSWLASVRSHCVTGITLPPVDATTFHCCYGLAWAVKKSCYL